jgi:solute carrier family 8 (sodium/calcium exchanger)
VFGCVCGIKDSVTAITFVAIGTSLPDTFASITAAKTSDTADSAIGNVTGSNSVNVFLGLGLPWVISSTYCESKGEWFKTPPGDLSYSVMLFIICSLFGFLTLAVRRHVSISISILHYNIYITLIFF